LILFFAGTKKEKEYPELLSMDSFPCHGENAMTCRCAVIVESFWILIISHSSWLLPTSERYGCPDFSHLNFDKRVEERLRSMGGILFDENRINDNYNECEITPPERTVTVACFPHETVGLTASLKHDQISPEPDYDNPVGQMSDLFRYATQPSSRDELEKLYEKGWADAEKWSYEEDLRERKLADEWLKVRRLKEEMVYAIKRGDLF
jgi:hypothetical protein